MPTAEPDEASDLPGVPADRPTLSRVPKHLADEPPAVAREGLAPDDFASPGSVPVDWEIKFYPTKIAELVDRGESLARLPNVEAAVPLAQISVNQAALAELDALADVPRDAVAVETEVRRRLTAAYRNLEEFADDAGGYRRWYDEPRPAEDKAVTELATVQRAAVANWERADAAAASAVPPERRRQQQIRGDASGRDRRMAPPAAAAPPRSAGETEKLKQVEQEMTQFMDAYFAGSTAESRLAERPEPPGPSKPPERPAAPDAPVESQATAAEIEIVLPDGQVLTQRIDRRLRPVVVRGRYRLPPAADPSGIEIRNLSGQALPYRFRTAWAGPSGSQEAKEPMPSTAPLQLVTRLSQEHVVVGSALTLHAVLNNHSPDPIRSLVVELPLPAGVAADADAVRRQFRARETLQQIDQDLILGRPLLAGGGRWELTVPLTATLPGTFATAPARAFPLQAPDMRSLADPLRLQIAPPAAEFLAAPR